VPDRLLTQNVSLPREWIGTPEPDNLARVSRFFEETLSEVRAMPGVTNAGAAIFPPFLAEGADRARFQIEGDPVPDPTEAPRALVHLVTPGYFETLGTRIVSGRSFDSRDDPQSPPVMIVSAELARRWFGDRSPLGRSITTEWTFTPGSPATRTVVGVVEDVAQLGPAEPVESQIYVPHAQSPFPSLALVVRAMGSPEELIRKIRETVWTLEPRAVLGEPTTLRQALSTNLRQPRFYAQLIGFFAGAAACLSALGLYGLLSYRVANQYRELGIRAALGATPGGLLAEILKSGLRVTLMGLAVGFAGALALSQLLESLLHGVGTNDPKTFVATTVFIVATTLAASWLPARRAAHVPVVEALRLDE
jgi:putative ABC transport system permease protein